MHDFMTNHLGRSDARFRWCIILEGRMRFIILQGPMRDFVGESSWKVRCAISLVNHLGRSDARVFVGILH